jgi:hypothetical protein
MTKVVHCKRSPYDVYIGRAHKGLTQSKWANPFHIGKDGTREEVIEKYREWILHRHELIASLDELKGKILGCWCAPHKCHGDVLVELANCEHNFIRKGTMPCGGPIVQQCEKCKRIEYIDRNSYPPMY